MNDKLYQSTMQCSFHNKKLKLREIQIQKPNKSKQKNFPAATTTHHHDHDTDHRGKCFGKILKAFGFEQKER
jgi:hypothetical protein